MGRPVRQGAAPSRIPSPSPSSRRQACTSSLGEALCSYQSPNAMTLLSLAGVAAAFLVYLCHPCFGVISPREQSVLPVRWTHSHHEPLAIDAHEGHPSVALMCQRLPVRPSFWFLVCHHVHFRTSISGAAFEVVRFVGSYKTDPTHHPTQISWCGACPTRTTPRTAPLHEHSILSPFPGWTLLPACFFHHPR